MRRDERVYLNIKINHRMELHRENEKRIKRSLKTWNDQLTAQLVHDKYKLEMELLSFIPPTFFKQITEPLNR